MYEYIYSDQVMGCELSVSLVTDNETYAHDTYTHMLALARTYDAQFSRFIQDSELSRLNKEKSIEVTPECVAVLRLGRVLYEKTHGAFNPLVNVARYGYDADIDIVQGREQGSTNAHGSYDIDFSKTDITDTHVTLADGQNIDVGGYLKGYVAERMTAYAPHAFGVIVNLGGDLYTRGYDAEHAAFLFDIEHPLAEHTPITFSYTDGAIATSGTYRRHWMQNGKPFHHILDTTGTKNPTSDIMSATVLAPHGHDAEAYATAALVLGTEKGKELLDQEALEYCFIRFDGSYCASAAFAKRVIQ